MQIRADLSLLTYKFQSNLKCLRRFVFFNANSYVPIGNWNIICPPFRAPNSFCKKVKYILSLAYHIEFLSLLTKQLINGCVFLQCVCNLTK